MEMSGLEKVFAAGLVAACAITAVEGLTHLPEVRESHASLNSAESAPNIMRASPFEVSALEINSPRANKISVHAGRLTLMSHNHNLGPR